MSMGETRRKVRECLARSILVLGGCVDEAGWVAMILRPDWRCGASKPCLLSLCSKA